MPRGRVIGSARIKDLLRTDSITLTLGAWRRLDLSRFRGRGFLRQHLHAMQGNAASIYSR